MIFQTHNLIISICIKHWITLQISIFSGILTAQITLLKWIWNRLWEMVDSKLTLSQAFNYDDFKQMEKLITIVERSIFFTSTNFVYYFIYLLIGNVSNSPKPWNSVCYIQLGIETFKIKKDLQYSNYLCMHLPRS